MTHRPGPPQSGRAKDGGFGIMKKQTVRDAAARVSAARGEQSLAGARSATNGLAEQAASAEQAAWQGRNRTAIASFNRHVDMRGAAGEDERRYG